MDEQLRMKDEFERRTPPGECHHVPSYGCHPINDNDNNNNFRVPWETSRGDIYIVSYSALADQFLTRVSYNYNIHASYAYKTLCIFVRNQETCISLSVAPAKRVQVMLFPGTLESITA